jgi:hypothetical protein
MMGLVALQRQVGLHRLVRHTRNMPDQKLAYTLHPWFLLGKMELVMFLVFHNIAPL